MQTRLKRKNAPSAHARLDSVAVQPCLRQQTLLKTVPHFADFVRRLRPAPVGAAVAFAFGLSKRRVVSTKYGRFLANPMSVLGSSLVNGEYEPRTTAVLGECLEPGNVFIDLGANEGYFSVIGSKLVGSEGKVVAIEPQSRLQSVLHANLALNDCSNVHVVSAVLSSKTKQMQLHLGSPLNTGGSSLYRPTRYPLRKETVQSITLGELLSRISVVKCDLMKVDIEGGEYEVFMSAESVLRSGVIKRIFLEIHHSILERQGLSGKKLHERILACGYEMTDILGNWVYTFSAAPSK
jgi:FkbM family methyltransferase